MTFNGDVPLEKPFHEGGANLTKNRSNTCKSSESSKANMPILNSEWIMLHLA
jgi:hypothetical protein